jgi:hypothetical protein
MLHGRFDTKVMIYAAELCHSSGRGEMNNLCFCQDSHLNSFPCNFFFHVTLAYLTDGFPANLIKLIEGVGCSIPPKWLTRSCLSGRIERLKKPKSEKSLSRKY